MSSLSRATNSSRISAHLSQQESTCTPRLCTPVWFALRAVDEMVSLEERTNLSPCFLSLFNQTLRHHEYTNVYDFTSKITAKRRKGSKIFRQPRQGSQSACEGRLVPQIPCGYSLLEIALRISKNLCINSMLNALCKLHQLCTTSQERNACLEIFTTPVFSFQ